MYVDPLRDPAAPRRAFPWLLVASLVVNTALASFLFFQWRDGTLWFEVEVQQAPLLAPVRGTALEEAVAGFAQKSDTELLSVLDDASPVANGYTIQELALALLRSRGYQVEEPLRVRGVWPQPMAPVSYKAANGAVRTVHLFTALSIADIHAVQAYIEATPVPYTAETIVGRLGKEGDLALLRVALSHTDEWTSLRATYPEASEESLFLLCQEIGPTNFTRLVAAKDSSFLIVLFAEKPSSALAELTLSLASKPLIGASDALLLRLLPLLNPKGAGAVKFSLALLKGQRKPPVWHAAQLVLAQATDNPSIASLPREEFLAKLVPPRVVNKPVQRSTSSTKALPQSFGARQLRPYRTYVVKKGDTLWGIARRFNVDVEKLKYLNRLKGGELPSPGRELRIPH